LSWRGFLDPAVSKVSVSLVEKGETTVVTLVHELPSKEGEWTQTHDQLKELWEKAMPRLKAVHETGFDPRNYQKPMFGFYTGDFINKEIAERRGLPFQYGHKIAGVIADMGAAKAGMKKDDLIVHVDGIPIKDWAALDSAIRGHQPGDVVQIELLRDTELIKLPVELASRPIPNIPANTQALSEAMSSFYSSANAQLREIIEDITEDEAEFRPAPAEWNVKDVFAHLIASERDTYTWVASLVHNQYRMPYTSNAAPRLKSLQRSYGPLPQLFQGLQAAQTEGVYLLSELPPELAERKNTFVPLAAELVEGTPAHYRDHMGQIEDNLSAVRALG
jgi:hypothetical protein